MVRLTAALVVITAVYAFLTYLIARANRKAVAAMRDQIALSRASLAATALEQLVIRQYLDRTFSATDAPEILGRRVATVREAKLKARQHLRNEDWEERSQSEDTPQNKIAFELSIALERVGVAVFTGIVPVRFLLSLAADQVVDDWFLCRAWIESYRTRQGISGTLPYHRRHAEWLVLLCRLWMHHHYPVYKSLSRFTTDVEADRRRFFEMSTAESDLMPDHVKHDIESLVGTRPNNSLQLTNTRVS
jgi:hypothetical protein